MKRLLSVVLWSVLAAAFIGPGTVTTAAKAGAEHRYALLWALLFSTLACVVLQEASARLALVSGRDLAAALRRGFRGDDEEPDARNRSAAGWGALLRVTLVLGAVVLGCAAYEAGNLLGAVAGAGLLTTLPGWVLTLAIGAVAALLLAVSTPRLVAVLLSGLVALMGAAFLITALLLRPPLAAVLTGAAVPQVPPGSGLLVLGLIGTTVVPYNLFLGSGLARDLRGAEDESDPAAHAARLATLRFGVAVAVVLGGVISMAVLVVGAAVAGSFSYEALGTVLSDRLGGWARSFFGFGLFVAGLSSAVTAPLAAALTARGLFSRHAEDDTEDDAADDSWGDRSWRYRAVWLAVLATGVGFGVAQVPPIPAIIAAQAFNGILLPVAALFLFFAVNDRRLMGEAALNGAFANLATAAVVAVTVVLGLLNLLKAAAGVLGDEPPREDRVLALALALTLVLAWPVSRRLSTLRGGETARRVSRIVPAIVLLGGLVLGLAVWRNESARTGSAVEPEITLALRGVTVLDLETGEAVTGRTVLVAGDRIAAVVPVEAAEVPAGVQVVDGGDRFLIPGLWDMHVHALWDREVAAVFLPWFVAHGVTGVRDMGGLLPILAEVRADDGTAYPLRPRLVAAGLIVDGPEPVQPEVSIAVANEEQARAAVARLQAAGADFVKVYTLLPRAAFFALAQEAHSRGLPVAGHLPAEVSPEEAAAAGMRSIEHLRDEIEPFCFGEPEALCAELLALFRATPIWQTPTLAVLRAKAHATDSGFADPALLARMPELAVVDWEAGRRRQAEESEGYREQKRLRFARELELVGRMHQAGVPLLAGTDTGVLYSIPGVSLHDELALLVEAGLSPLEALRTATVEPARYLDREADFGAVAVGRIADLVLLDADPRVDIANTRAIAGVVLAGRWWSRSKLDAELER